MIKVGFKNTKKVLGDFSRFENVITKEMVEHFNQAIPESFYDISKKLFDSEGASGDHGKKWEPLSDNYKAWKEKHYPGKTIMRRTDRLYKSLTSHTADSIKFIGNVAGRLRIKLGSKLDYGEYWQEGVMTRRGKITRRTIDPLEKQMYAFLKVIHRAYVYAARYGPFKKGWKIDVPKFDKKDV